MIPPALWASIVKNVKVFRQHWILTLAMAALPAGKQVTCIIKVSKLLIIHSSC